jgi:hypothetical protein
MKPIKFIIRQNNKGFFCSIESSNGNNLNPADPQKEKRKVKNAIKSLKAHILAESTIIIDETVKKK